MNNISVSLFRVSSDSKYLDMIFDCPSDYYFNSLLLTVKYFLDGKLITLNFDISSALFIVNMSDADVSGQPHILSTVKKKHWTVRLPLNKIGINYPAIYDGTIKAVPVYSIYASGSSLAWPAPYSNCKKANGTNAFKILNSTIWTNNEDLQNPDVLVLESGVAVSSINASQIPTTDLLTTLMICSDVNFAYRCMLDEILEMGENCSDLSEDAIKNYLILYGHQAAMNVRDLEVAEKYFSLINKCFTKCDNKERITHGTAICNCGK